MDEQRAAAVVVGVDGSSTALHAVRWATREAHRRGAPLRIVHAAPYARGNTMGERHAGSILTLAHTAATQTLPDVPTDTERLGGPMPQALVEASAGVQLLVVGMGGGSRVDDVLLHSDALDVAAAATCPVAVVRGRHDPVPDNGPVVLGIDDAGADAAAVAVAFADAQRHGGRLTVVHAVHTGAPTRTFRFGYDARAALESEVLERLRPWRSRHPGVPVELQVVSGGATGHLLEASVTARLLVLGTRARGAAARAVLGSTSRAVLRRSSCPVLVVGRDAVLAESTASASATPAPAPAPQTEQRWAVHPQDRGERW
jgi:nucleotide-binding universal stress UspA family protein